MELGRPPALGRAVHLGQHHTARRAAACRPRLVHVGCRTLYFATHESAQKARNLRHELWVVLHAGDGDDVIILEGRAEVVKDDAEARRVDAMRAEKYVEPRTGARDTILTEGTILYRVRVQHVMAWMYGDMAGRTDWWLDAAPAGESHAAPGD